MTNDPYCVEPAPNGEAPNQGAWGNTPMATPSAAGAPHMDCP